MRPIRTKIIFRSQHYTACEMADGSLVVTSNHRQRGKRLVGETAKVWITAIKEAMASLDKPEAGKLCLGIMGG